MKKEVPRVCFSAEASFTVGAALVPAGVYCVTSALQRNRALVPLALVPFAFGLQQLGEGLVWRGLASGDPELVRKASVFFLFFAIPFWPFWIPLSFLFMEQRMDARYVLGAFVLLSLAWIGVSYPLFAEPEKWLITRQVHHSIQYDFDNLPAFRLMPETAYRLLYLAAICGPFPVRRRGGTGRARLVVGGAVAVFFLIAYLIFWYAFTSVWCFFAAILSVYLCYFFYRLPIHKPAGKAEDAASGTLAHVK